MTEQEFLDLIWDSLWAIKLLPIELQSEFMSSLRIFIHRRKLIGLMQVFFHDDANDEMRLAMKYFLFDIECTRRENED